MHKQHMRIMVWMLSFSAVAIGVTWLIGAWYHGFWWQMADALAHNLVVSLRTESATKVMIWLSNMGLYGSLFIWLVLAGVFAVRRDFGLLLQVIFLSAGGFGLGYGWKLLASRMRPVDVALIEEVSHSFPSLHSMAAILLCLFLSYLVYYYSRRFVLSFLVFALGFLFAFFIGLSRLYLGVHYLSDVVGGFSLGIGWFLFVLSVEKCFSLFAKKTDKSV